MVKLIYEDGQNFFLKKGDYVDLDFYVSGMISAAQVVSLKTTGKDKVLVDVDVVIDYGPISKTKVRIHGIDSHCCRLRDEAYMNELNEKENRKAPTEPGIDTPVFKMVFRATEYPERDGKELQSYHVVVDIDGRGLYFDTAFYDYDEKRWYNLNKEFTETFEKGEFFWWYHK